MMLSTDINANILKFYMFDCVHERDASASGDYGKQSSL